MMGSVSRPEDGGPSRTGTADILSAPGRLLVGSWDRRHSVGSYWLPGRTWIPSCRPNWSSVRL